MNINLSKFKKLKEDAVSATMKHPDGHEFKIAKSSLNPQTKKELSSLPLHLEEGTPDAPIQMADNEDDAGYRSLGAKEEASKTGDVEFPTIGNKEEVGPPTPTSEDVYNDKASERLQSLRNQNYSHQPDEVLQKEAKDEALNDLVKEKEQKDSAQKEEEKTKASNIQYQNSALANHYQYELDHWSAENQKRAQINLPPLPKPTPPIAMSNQVADTSESPLMPNSGAPAQAQAVNQAPTQIPNAAPNQTTPGSNQPDPYGIQAYYDAYNQGLQGQKEGLQNQATAESQLGQEQAKTLEPAIAQQQQTANDFKSHYSELEQERQSFIRDIQNQHVDSSHYLSSMGTAGKISTAIGLILGGIGGGGQGNMALDFVNKQISNDIEAQKVNIGKSENLLTANMRQFGNLRDATDMTRIMQTDIIKNQLALAAAKSQDPLAKARAQQAIGQLDMQAAPILSQMAMRRSLLSGMQTGSMNPSMSVRMLVPEGQQNDAYKELKSAENMSRQRDNLLGAFEQLSKTNSIGNRISSPLQTSKQVSAIREPLLAQLVKDSEGRITPTDVEMLRGLFPAPGDDQNTMATKKLQMRKFIDEKMNFPMLDSFGIRVGNMGRFNTEGNKRIQLQPPVLGK